MSMGLLSLPVLLPLFLLSLPPAAVALHVVLAGGTGPLGQAIAHSLSQTTSDHEVTILTRNAFLAATPSRVSEDFGWVGERFMKMHPQVKLRDWDGGDLLDIVGKDWIGWQVDSLSRADVVVHLVGGFTAQRVMACERIVRETSSVCPGALQVTVNPISEELPTFSPGVTGLKLSRIETCEKMVQSNCRSFKCLRIESFRLQQGCDEIVSVIEDWASSSGEK